MSSLTMLACICFHESFFAFQSPKLNKKWRRSRGWCFFNSSQFLGLGKDKMMRKASTELYKKYWTHHASVFCCIFFTACDQRQNTTEVWSEDQPSVSSDTKDSKHCIWKCSWSQKEYESISPAPKQKMNNKYNIILLHRHHLDRIWSYLIAFQ